MKILDKVKKASGKRESKVLPVYCFHRDVKECEFRDKDTNVCAVVNYPYGCQAQRAARTK